MNRFSPSKTVAKKKHDFESRSRREVVKKQFKQRGCGRAGLPASAAWTQSPVDEERSTIHNDEQPAPI